MNNIAKFSCGVSIGNDIYASALYNNGLYRIDKDTGISRLVLEFLNSNIDDSKLHSGAILIDDRIYFIPNKADCINVYEINTNNQYIINPDNRRFDCEYKGIVIGTKIYLVPIIHNRDILCLDTEQDRITVYFSYNDLKDLYIETEEPNTFIRVANRENNIILVQYGTNRVISIDTGNNRQISFWDIETEGLIGVFEGTKGVWALEINTPKLYLLDVVNHKIIQTINWKPIHKQKLEIGWIKELDNYVYLFPSKGETIYVIKNENDIYPITLSDKLLSKQIKINRIMNPILEKKEIWVLPNVINKLLKINKEGILEIKVYTNESDNRLISYAKYTVKKNKHEMLQEGEILNLSLFIQGIN